MFGYADIKVNYGVTEAGSLSVCDRPESQPPRLVCQMTQANGFEKFFPLRGDIYIPRTIATQFGESGQGLVARVDEQPTLNQPPPDALSNGGTMRYRGMQLNIFPDYDSHVVLAKKSVVSIGLNRRDRFFSDYSNLNGASVLYILCLV